MSIAHICLGILLIWAVLTFFIAAVTSSIDSVPLREGVRFGIRAAAAAIVIMVGFLFGLLLITSGLNPAK